MVASREVPAKTKQDPLLILLIAKTNIGIRPSRSDDKIKIIKPWGHMVCTSGRCTYLLSSRRFHFSLDGWRLEQR